MTEKPGLHNADAAPDSLPATTAIPATPAWLWPRLTGITLSGITLSSITIEGLLWGLLLFLALALRLLRLDAAPLTGAEAHGALSAWRAPVDTAYSPALFSAQWFTFRLFSAGDWTARLWPALGGTALALAPALLRRQLGRYGALAAGALLALSPTAVVLSRTASGDIFVALGALLLAAGLLNNVLNPDPDTSKAAAPATPMSPRFPNAILGPALGLALMLTASPLAYSALLALAAALLLLALSNAEVRARVQSAWHSFRTEPNAPAYTLAVFGGAFVLLGTAGAWHLEGLGAVANLFPRWLDGFVVRSNSLAFSYPLTILLLYEPLTLLTGGTGLLVATLRRYAPALFLALWSLLALLLAWLRPGRSPGDVLLIVVPLACVGGLASGRLIQGLRRWGSWLNEGLYLAVSAVLWIYMVMGLMTYTHRPGDYAQLNLLVTRLAVPTYLSLAVATTFFWIIVTFGAALVQGVGPTLRGVGLAATTVLLVYTVGATWGVSQHRPADPREPLIVEPTSRDVRLLQESLFRLSNQRRGSAYAVDVSILTEDPAVLAGDPALAWALRDFENVQFATEPGPPISTTVVIAPAILGPPQLVGNYVGQDLTLRERWTTETLACRWSTVQYDLGDLTRVSQLDCSAPVGWLLYRRSLAPVARERVILWVRQVDESG